MSHPIDFLRGLLFAALAIPVILLLAVDPGRVGWQAVVGGLVVAAVGWSYMASPFLARRIAIGNRALSFQPVGFELPLEGVKAIEWARGQPAEGLVNGIGLAMRERRLRWVPARLLWVGRRCSLRLLGTDGAAIHAALEDALAARGAAP